MIWRDPSDVSGERLTDGILYPVILIWQKRRLYHCCEYVGAEAPWPVGPYLLPCPPATAPVLPCSLLRLLDVQF